MFLNKHYIENHRILKFDGLADFIPSLRDVELSERKDTVCDYLSNIAGIEGFIYKNYCHGGTKSKKNNGYISPMRMAKRATP